RGLWHRAPGSPGLRHPGNRFGRGGATETILPLGGRHQPTGLWFEEQTIDCLAVAMQRFETLADQLVPEAARRPALVFNHHRFGEEIISFLHSVLRLEGLAVRRAA